ncbi:ATP-binding protein [Arsenophonus apicola]|uniref:ATP-binding protein n=1 Tax=Arsenophonus apicola TaxID=2879119 RepID=UPI0038796388
MDIIQRLQKIMPENIKPIACSWEEHLAKMQKISEEASLQDAVFRKQHRIENLFGRSGIAPLHAHCRFENYRIFNAGQKNALNQSVAFVKNFGTGFGGFIFSGGCGTGKNHLAASIGYYLMSKGRSVLCITVADLMMRFRATYEKNTKLTEQQLLDELCKVDLLILDEIGIQYQHSENTKIIVNQLVDRRTSHKKPIGMLTNLNSEQIRQVLGDRIIDRMMMSNGIWLNFNWSSYRRKVQ